MIINQLDEDNGINDNDNNNDDDEDDDYDDDDNDGFIVSPDQFSCRSHLC